MSRESLYRKKQKKERILISDVVSEITFVISPSPSPNWSGNTKKSSFTNSRICENVHYNIDPETQNCSVWRWNEIFLRAFY